MRPTVERPAELVTVIVVGLGNIGSHVVSHLARLVEVGRLVLIDPDTYGDSNRRSQSIGCDDIGRAKADVQAALARRINPGLAVSGLAESVEDVPLGWLRGELIFACLDSRSARQYVNESARKLGVPWIDAGVEPGNWLARVNVYEPGREAPCLECAWDQRDYDALPQRYPCASIEPGPATAAPSSLGALAASLQAVEGQKLLSGRKADAVVGAQVLIDARTYHLYRTVMRRNPTCRLSHDDPIEITPVDSTVGQLTVPDMLALDAGTGGSSDVGLEVPMHSWASRQLCMECGRATDGPGYSGLYPGVRHVMARSPHLASTCLTNWRETWCHRRERRRRWRPWASAITTWSASGNPVTADMSNLERRLQVSNTDDGQHGDR